THTSSTSTQGQKMTAQEVMPDDGYQLHLGAYQSELGARLMWVSLEADPGMLLNGLDPAFKRQQGEGGTFYHVLAGTYARRDIADSHCAWLKEREVACSIVGG
ncbi:MAG: SPOR domain-containing protein, partial [Geminicoccaceae bacterium]